MRNPIHTSIVHARKERSNRKWKANIRSAPGELEGQNLLAKLSEFVADSDLSIPRIAQLMGVSGTTLTAWMSRTAKPRRVKLLEIRSFLDLHGP